MSSIISVILAAGKGKRMNSARAKVLHEVCGKSMIEHVLKAVEGAGVKNHCVIVGHQKQEVKNHLKDHNCLFATQDEQLGTGHAVQMCESVVDHEATLLILCGDTPCLKSQTLKDFLHFYQENEAKILILSTKIQNPQGYGRIIRDELAAFVEIREDRDCTPSQREINEINTGIYLVPAKLAFELLNQVRSDNDQNEYYLTDIAKIAMQRGVSVDALSLGNPEEFLGVNTVAQLQEAEEVLKNC